MTQNSSRRAFRLSLLSFIVALMAMSFITLSVSAHTLTPTKGVTPSVNHFMVQIVQPRSAPLPGASVYNPDVLYTHDGDSVTICNRTNQTQQITDKSTGQVILTLKPHQCRTGTVSGNGKVVLGLVSNPTATLTINVSPI